MIDGVKIYADFQKLDDAGRVILSCAGTLRDLALNGIKLEDGLALTFYSDDADDEGNPDDIIAKGVVQYDKPSNAWVALIDWAGIKHASDYQEER